MRSLVAVLLVGLSVVLVGCDSGEGETPEIANPAAVYCEEQGGTVSGDEPMCTLPDGTEVDAWDYYRANNPGE